MLAKIKPSQRFHKENKMRILVALIAVFMVSGAVAQKKPTTPSISENIDLWPCAQVQGGPNWSCKNPKTGKVVSIECKVPPKMKTPKQLSGAELKELCPNWNQGDWNGDG